MRIYFRFDRMLSIPDSFSDSFSVQFQCEPQDFKPRSFKVGSLTAHTVRFEIVTFSTFDP